MSASNFRFSLGAQSLYLELSKDDIYRAISMINGRNKRHLGFGIDDNHNGSKSDLAHTVKLGFYGINPSVTLPAWFTGTPRLIVYYAGGLVPGLILLLTYLFYWMRRYRRQPAILSWSLGLVTIVLAAMQLAIAYMEGHYHEAYINNAGSLFSPTNILVCGFMVAALFLHSALSSRTRMRKANQPAEDAAPEIRRG